MAGVFNNNKSNTTFLVDNPQNISIVIFEWCLGLLGEPLDTTKSRILFLSGQQLIQSLYLACVSYLNGNYTGNRVNKDEQGSMRTNVYLHLQSD